jgi:hypothetical protein
MNDIQDREGSAEMRIDKWLCGGAFFQVQTASLDATAQLDRLSGFE